MKAKSPLRAPEERASFRIKVERYMLGAKRILGWPIIVLLWLMLIIVTLATRPLLPVDETRYLAVAWDMWREGNYLVPHLNGEPYSHKPPLLFWLMTMGWHLFGVNEWWPRIVAPLFGLIALLLSARLGRMLWPAESRLPRQASILLFGALFWTIFSTLTMFDMLLAVFTLIALIGTVDAALKGGRRGFVLMGLAMGFGALTKGPAILLHVLPVALAAPWWASNIPSADVGPKSRWYFGVIFSICVTLAISLSWAIPAGLAGGEEYRNAIFWGQSADRMLSSFAHARPLWWYLTALPIVTLPWVIWPKLWRASKAATNVSGDGGLQFCLVWFAVAFFAFSLISGKQLHYLLPEFPAIALIAARVLLLYEKGDIQRAIDFLVPGGLAIIAGILMIFAAWLPLSSGLMALIPEIRPEAGILIVMAGAVVISIRDGDIWSESVRLAFISVFVVLALHFAAAPYLDRRYDLTRMGAFLHKMQLNGKKVAYFGKYHGQFHFLGRLRDSFAVIGLRSGQEERFLRRYSDGVIVAKYRDVPRGADPLFTSKYRRFTYVVWEAEALRTNPNIGNRR